MRFSLHLNQQACFIRQGKQLKYTYVHTLFLLKEGNSQIFIPSLIKKATERRYTSLVPSFQTKLNSPTKMVRTVLIFKWQRMPKGHLCHDILQNRGKRMDNYKETDLETVQKFHQLMEILLGFKQQPNQKESSCRKFKLRLYP